MKFPYGNADFYKIVTEDYFYVDRTEQIPFIEDAGDILLLLRPRRFGKSLLLSVLENYYDINKADEFARLFGHLDIGQHPTERQGQYLILRWDFSVVATQGEVAEIKQALYNHLNNAAYSFEMLYRDLLPRPLRVDPQDAIASFEDLLTVARDTPYKVYLLIDEYDNFANEVLMARRSDSQQRYEALIQGEGMLKTLFKAVKTGTQGRGLDRVFITGVSPVVMSDITSGFSIAKDIYLRPQFNTLCGFQEAEIAAVLQQLGETCGFSQAQVAQALTTMRTFYNGYSFTYDVQPTLYNPTLALYFLERFAEGCQYPEKMLDSNLAMDRAKIAYVASLPYGERVVTAALDETQSLSIEALADRFGVEEMMYAAKDKQFMISLLYYFGVLTLSGQRTAFEELILQVPNLVTRKLYVERIQETLLPTGHEIDIARQAAKQLYQRGQIQPLCDLVEQKLFAVLDNRDYRWADEFAVKALFLTLLFNDILYVMDSEPALRRQYGDLIMLVRPDRRHSALLDILIEFKYVKLSALHLSGTQVREMARDELRALPLVKQALGEAAQQLTDYRRTLAEAYGDQLRLHTYSVVALGFERLVWMEVGGDLNIPNLKIPNDQV